MSELSDHELDQRLRQVSLPLGLLARVRNIAEQEPSASDADLALFSDDALDQQLLAGVEMPAGLLDRVQATIADAAADEAIDERLNAVIVPRSLVAHLQSIPWESRRRRVARWAVAASWVVMASVLYYGGLGTIFAQFQPRDPQGLDWLVVEVQPTELRMPDDDEGVTFVSLPNADDTMLVSDESAAPLPELIVPVSYPQPGPAGEVFQQLASGWQPWQDLLIARYNLLGSPSDAADRLPPLESVPSRSSQGLKPPLVRGYDRAFLLSQGVHPLVNPELNPELRTVRVPLDAATTSFEKAKQRLLSGRFPDRSEVRIAEVLAAMEYPLPRAATGKIGLVAAAGPSPFGATLGNLSPQLVQVAVQCGPVASASQYPMHLTVALDISASMNAGGRLAAAQVALDQALTSLGPEDRLSLLLFNDQNAYEVSRLTRDDAPQIRPMLAQLTGSGGTNLAGAIQQAASLAMSELDSPRTKRHLAIVTDGRANLPRETAGQLQELLGTLHHQGLAWSLIDLSDKPEPDTQFLALCATAGGKFCPTPDVADCQWLLVEKLLARSTMVAPDAKLEVVFNPQAVAAYRLIGHETTRLAGLEPELVTADLRAGQVATGLFEVWLKPNSQDDVAVAVLTWLDPASSEPRRVEQRISRLQFATSFAEASLALQAATIAAETGEALQQSPYVSNRGRVWADIRALAAQTNPRLAQRPSFQQFLELVDLAERVRAKQ